MGGMPIEVNVIGVEADIGVGRMAVSMDENIFIDGV